MDTHVSIKNKNPDPFDSSNFVFHLQSLIGEKSSVRYINYQNDEEEE